MFGLVLKLQRHSSQRWTPDTSGPAPSDYSTSTSVTYPMILYTNKGARCTPRKKGTNNLPECPPLAGG
eukprot:733853-Pelagomonas_calceolata.AAC.1